MRLNNINDRIVKVALLSGLKRINVEDYVINPLSDKQFAIKHAINDNTNKLIDKIDLGFMLLNVPQDIRDIDFSVVVSVQVDSYLSKLKEYNPIHYPELDNEVSETNTGELGKAFCNWKRLIGIQDLSYDEVDLSYNDNYLHIDITSSKKYTGEIKVRIS